MINIVSDLLAAGCWFSLRTPVSSTNKTDHHNITEILLKVELNTINQQSMRREVVNETVISRTIMNDLLCSFTSKFSLVVGV